MLQAPKASLAPALAKRIEVERGGQRSICDPESRRRRRTPQLGSAPPAFNGRVVANV